MYLDIWKNRNLACYDKLFWFSICVTGTKLEEIYHNKSNFQIFKHLKCNQLMRTTCKKKSVMMGDYSSRGNIIIY